MEFDGKGVAVERRVVVGDPAQAILAETDEPGVGMVVLGARGLGPVKRLLLGSVSDRVLRHACCPVLIVKGRGR